MNLLQKIGVDSDYIMLGMLAVVLIMFILIIILFVKTGKQKKRLNNFMSGADAKSLEHLILEKISDIDLAKSEIGKIKVNITDIEESFERTFSKYAIVKYDAFKEMGGKLSFVLVILNVNNKGFIINSMHSNREGCFTYIKEVIDGKSFVTLSSEEKQALDEAINSTNYME